MTATTQQIFAGLRVVDLTTGMAGPMAAMQLADHGADVIKVESPDGDWARHLPAFAMWNRGKRGVTCDLDQDADAELVRDLVATADVVFDTCDAQVLQRCGLSADELSELNPGVVLCTIGGFPTGSDLSGVRAYEGVVAAATGRMTGLDQLSGGQAGRVYDTPAFTAAPVASFGAAQLALQGVVAALLQRANTGRGQRVDTSLLHGSMAFLMRQELNRGADTSGLAISPATHRGIELCFLTAECADGRYIQMCARQDQHFHNWLRAVGLEHMLAEPRFARAPMGIHSVDDVVELEQLLRERMRTRTQDEWMRTFTDEYDVGADPFLTPAEFLAHPDMVDNDRVVEIVDPIFGRVRQVGALVLMRDTPALIEMPAPALGAADAEVRAGRPWASDRMMLPVPDATSPGQPPLTGVTILEVAYYIAGPMATTLLAELGARVIKVEPMAGDPFRRTGLQSAKFVQGKESLTLDLKHPDGAAILDDLIDRADVVVHSFRSAAARKLGLDAERVLERNRRAVHLYAASYGSRGPQRDRAAFHSTPNALSGGGIKQAGRDNPPVNDSYADPGSALGAATAIVMGLWARHVIGTGQALETTMLTSTGYIHSSDAVEIDGVANQLVADRQQRGLGAAYRLYQARDGWLFLAAISAAERNAASKVLGLDELGDVGSDAGGESDDELAAKVAAIVATDDAEGWVRQLTEAGVGAAVVSPLTFDTWLDRAGLLIEASHPMYGDYWRIPPKVALSGSRPVLGAAAAAGEHSAALLRELGYEPADIDRLFADGVSSDGRPVSV